MTHTESRMFEQDGEEHVIATARSRHPLGKCVATSSLLAYLITSKYADSLRLYRQGQMFKRLGQDSETSRPISRRLRWERFKRFRDGWLPRILRPWPKERFRR